MIKLICDCCGREINDEAKRVAVYIEVAVKIDDKNRSLTKHQADFHPDCFRQCFNTFLDSNSKCFLDLMEEGENE